jgi:hypothetical protein
MSSIFNLGGVLGAIKPPKLKQINYSDALQKQQDLTTESLGGYRAGQAADLAKYGTAIDEATGKVKALEGSDNDILSRLISQSGQDPMDTYKGIGDYQFSILDKLSGDLAGRGKAEDNLLMARFGAGGRGGSTYQTNSILDRISKNLAPVYAGALGNLGRDTGIVVGGRDATAGNVTNLINARAGIPLRTLPLQTATMDQRSQNLFDEIAAQGGMGQNYRTNSAGFKEEPNKWAAAIGEIDKSLNSAVDTGMSIYGGGGGGGILGILGSLMGGGRASTPNAGTFINQGGIPDNNNTNLLRSLVNGGGGQTNTQAIIALLTQMLGQNQN